ncbi:type II secretion system protein [bacterium]|nr:type II secretion system protein [bacterium]
MKKLSGFTLAEVLITIGVIGAVAAMTLPNIKLAYSKKLTLTQLEKTYSTLANTIKMSEYHNGKVKRWKFADESNAVPPKEIFDKYFKGYMKYALEMQSSELTIGTNERKFLNGRPMNEVTGNWATKAYNEGYHVIMMDGAMVSFWTRPKTGDSNDYAGTVIMIDTNGETAPNTMGKDTFMFYLGNTGLLPMGHPDGTSVSRATASNTHNLRVCLLGRSSSYSGNAACDKDKYGLWCAALIMLDGWHISKDYPWDKH